MDDKEFMKMLGETCKGEHCPEDLVKMAKSRWQKQVAVEFVLFDKRINSQAHKLSTIYKITWGIFSLVAVGAVMQVIAVVIPWITSFL